MSNIILGIDLGTTHSSVSIMLSNEIKIADGLRGNRIPSIVHFTLNDEGELEYDVGYTAQKYLIRDPSMTIYDTKRMLGRQYDDEEIQQLIPTWPFTIKKNEEDGEILIFLEKINKTLKPYEVSGYILKFLAELGNKFLSPDQKTSDVIITIPANFGDAQREETKKAAEFANLNLKDMINEPTSAGISYGMSHKYADLKRIVVFDFGGGTLDVSLLTIEDNNFKVVASDGDMFLGGRNFDDKIVDYMIKKNGLEKICKKPKYMQILRENAIKIKEDLSETDKVEEYFDLGDEEINIKLTVSDFEKITKELIDKILIPIDKLLKAAKEDKENVDQVILVGGSSHMKFVKRILTNYFGEEPFFDINSSTAIARGAAYVASNFTQEEDSKKIEDDDDIFEEEEEEVYKGPDINKSQAVNDDDDDDDDDDNDDDDDDDDNRKVKISPKESKTPNSIFETFKYQDICPFSIGILTYGGKFCTIIPKGKEIPVKMEGTFVTLLYRQESFKVHIFQGISNKVEENYYLGYFSVDEFPISENPIEFKVILELKRNGILCASASTINCPILQQKELKVRKIKNGTNAKNHGFKSENENEDISEKKVILENIKRYIDFNRDDILLTHISEGDINHAIDEINFFKDNLDGADTPKTAEALISYFANILKKYLKTLPKKDIPDFLNAPI